MPTDSDTLKWVEVYDFSPGIFDPRGTVLNSKGYNIQFGPQQGAPLGAAQLIHAARPQAPFVMADSSGNGHNGLYRVDSVQHVRPGVFLDSSGIQMIQTQDIDNDLTPVSTAQFAGDFTIIAWLSFDVGGNASFGQFKSATHTRVTFGWANDPTKTLTRPFGTSALTLTRQWGAAPANGFSISTLSLSPDPFNPPGIYMVAVRYRVATGTASFFLQGNLLDTIVTGAGPGLADPVNLASIGGGPADFEFGHFALIPTATMVDGDFSDLYNLRTNTAAYVAHLLTFSPSAYYKMDDSPQYQISPGTYRCICVPGKGLVGAPRKNSAARVLQPFADISPDGISG